MSKDFRLDRLRKQRRDAYKFSFCDSHIEEFMGDGGKPPGCPYCQLATARAEIGELTKALESILGHAEHAKSHECQNVNVPLNAIRRICYATLPTKDNDQLRPKAFPELFRAKYGTEQGTRTAKDICPHGAWDARTNTCIWCGMEKGND